MNAIQLKDTEFWCNECSSCKVHSDKPETGKFFSQFGHVYDCLAQAPSDNYDEVIFALCKDCCESFKLPT